MLLDMSLGLRGGNGKGVMLRPQRISGKRALKIRKQIHYYGIDETIEIS